MARHATAQQRSGARSVAPPFDFARIAFSAWSAAFAVGALIHEWQLMQPMTLPKVLVALAAVFVLLRPTAPARVVLLLGMLSLEALTELPNEPNHLFLIGVLGATIGPWWLWLRWRSPEEANDPAVLYERVGPYLRVAVILTWAVAALAKFNTGFTDVVATCSTWILDTIPGIRVPELATPVVIAGTMALELLVPALLLFHRTRPFAVVLAFGFHLISAIGGHSAFSGFAWSLYIFFLPPALIARAVVTGRRSLPAPVRRGLAAAARHAPITLTSFGVAWVSALWLVMLAPGAPEWYVRWGLSALVCVLWMTFTASLLVRLRRHWIGGPALRASLRDHWAGPARPRASLRVRNGVMLLGLAALVLTAAMPYLGLKTRTAFTMYSNIRTEPGYWNHLLVPESARLFDWQAGEVRVLGTDDAALTAEIEAAGAERTVLLGLRRIVAEFPEATVRYELDGVERVAAPVSSDPVLGEPLPPVQDWLAAMRPYVEGGTCQH